MKKFIPPDAAARKSALGPDPPEWLQALGVTGHEPIHVPRREDWNYGRNATGQTFGVWQQTTKPENFAKRDTIYLQPLGDFDPMILSPSLEHLQAFAAAYFQVQVRLLPPIGTATKSFRGLVTRPADPDENALGGVQISCNSVCALLKRNLPADALCVAGLTMYDLYAKGL